MSVCGRLPTASPAEQATPVNVPRRRTTGHGAIAFQIGVTGVRTPAAMALHLGRGVCQDFAHLLLCVLRLLAIPARYVSGQLLGEGVPHAWVECLVDGEVIAYDPTHGRRARLDYVTVAVGRDFADVTPTSGVFSGAATASWGPPRRLGCSRFIARPADAADNPLPRLMLRTGTLEVSGPPYEVGDFWDEMFEAPDQRAAPLSRAGPPAGDARPGRGRAPSARRRLVVRIARHHVRGQSGPRGCREDHAVRPRPAARAGRGMATDRDWSGATHPRAESLPGRRLPCAAHPQ